MAASHSREGTAATAGVPFRRERTERFPVARETLWTLVTDTDRLNRETGLPPARFSFLPRDEGGSRVRGEMRLAGLNLRYDEEPYAWVRPERFSVARHIDNGPLSRIDLGMSFAPDGEEEATLATAWFSVTPRGPLALPVARTVARIGVNSLLAACRGFAAYIAGETATPYPKHSGTPAADRERLSRAVDALTRGGADPALSARLADFVTAAPIEDVVTIRPFALADRWGIPREKILHTCLLAVRAELLEMRWRILCPSCRGAGDAVEQLGDLAKGEAHCPSCNIRFGPEFDRSVEVCFRVAPRIRSVAEGEATYCIGGPGRSPHLALQWPLAPGQADEVTVELTPGRYRILSPQAAQPLDIELRPDAPEPASSAAIRLCDAAGAGAAGKRAAFSVSAPVLPARGKWRLENATGYPALLRLETPGWLADVATAAVVTSLQAFRDSFGSEVLSPGVEISVRQIAILFSDLKGSTAMYRERGDAPSYAAVRDHFGLMREVIGRGGRGGIVKTIGDAVMAVFPDPADALAAALEIQTLCPLQKEALTVKVGLHAGPALAVNANGALDYFGQVVNLAARIQAQSVGGDVVIARTLSDDPHIAALIEGLPAEQLTVVPHGTLEPMDLLRLWPSKARQEGNGDAAPQQHTVRDCG